MKKKEVKKNQQKKSAKASTKSTVKAKKQVKKESKAKKPKAVGKQKVSSPVKKETKSKKTQEVSAKKNAKVVEKKVPILIPKKLIKEIPSEQNAQNRLIATPTDKMLKPFRDAAKRTQLINKEKQKNKKKTNFIAKPAKTAKKVYLDLRVHSPVSEGYLSTGGVDPAIAMLRLAKAKGLDMIAVTDYHSAEFIDILKSRTKETDIKVLPGLDLRCKIGSCDEVYMVALFPESYSSSELNQILNKLEVPANKRGVRNFCIEKSISEVVKVVESKGGVIIPSRIDITPSTMKTLHELVDKLGFHVFDLAHPDNPEYFKEHWPDGQFTFMSFSNANALGQIGARTNPVRIPELGFEGIKNLASRR